MGRIAEFAIFVAALALAKPVLVPIALAFYLAFVLTPPSNRLERMGLPRAWSLTTVVGFALACVGGLGAVLATQAAELSRQFKTYAVQMGQKVSGLRAGNLGGLADLSAALAELGKVLDPAPGAGAPARPVRLVTGGQSAFQRLEEALGPLLQPLALVAIVFVMAIFMLGHRENLRGRLVQLLGPENLTVTTRTMAEAVDRVGRLLLTQAYINTGMAAVLGVGLHLIGTPYALLWGVLAGVLRFVPLLGTLIATSLPTLVAFAVFPGWREAGLTLGLFVIVESLVANFVEPMVLGKRTGVSALALLISALFWTWLWGPAGLLLATPLTVCAAVIGRHVPELAFLTIALGDEVALNPEIDFYQRLLVRATKDGYRMVKRRAAESSFGETFDELVVPSLGFMVRDLNQQTINQHVADRLLGDLTEITTRCARDRPSTPAAATGSRVLGLAAESQADALLLQMLRVSVGEAAEWLLLPHGERARSVELAIKQKPELICIAALPPTSNVNARFLCRRLRAELPEAYIVVLVPEAESQRSKESAARLREAGASITASSLREATRLLLENRAVRGRSSTG